MTLQSTTPNAVRAGANRRNLLAIVGVTAVAVGLAVSYNVPWTSATPVEARRSEVGPLAIGSVFNVATEIGNVALTVAALDGNTVIVTDSEGDRIALTVAQLTSGMLPSVNVDVAAARNLRRVQCYAKHGAYAAMQGVSGPVPTVAACHD